MKHSGPKDTDASSGDLTDLVNQAEDRHVSALHSFFRAHHEELRTMAARIMRRERPDHTLQPTALVHEVYLKFLDQNRVTEKGILFFKRCFARQCRSILVDHARAHQRRGGKLEKHMLRDSETCLGMQREVELLELDNLIEVLGQKNERLGAVVEMRVFAGMTIRECAKALGVSSRTIDNDWSFARTWLKKEFCR